MDRPEGMDRWRTRADYTHVNNGWLEPVPGVLLLLMRAALDHETGEIQRAARMVASLCKARCVLPVRCGARVHIPGRLIAGWSRLPPEEREHDDGWLGVAGAISVTMGHDHGDRMIRMAVDVLEMVADLNQADLIEALAPICIGGPTPEPFVHGWMESGELEALAVSVDAAFAAKGAS